MFSYHFFINVYQLMKESETTSLNVSQCFIALDFSNCIFCYLLLLSSQVRHPGGSPRLQAVLYISVWMLNSNRFKHILQLNLKCNRFLGFGSIQLHFLSCQLLQRIGYIKAIIYFEKQNCVVLSEFKSDGSII